MVGGVDNGLWRKQQQTVGRHGVQSRTLRAPPPIRPCHLGEYDSINIYWLILWTWKMKEDEKVKYLFSRYEYQN